MMLPMGEPSLAAEQAHILEQAPTKNAALLQQARSELQQTVQKRR